MENQDFKSTQVVNYGGSWSTLSTQTISGYLTYHYCPRHTSMMLLAVRDPRPKATVTQ
jgi:hypothetical protein